MESNKDLKKKIEGLKKKRMIEIERRNLERELRRLKNPQLTNLVDNSLSLGKSLAKRLSENQKRMSKKRKGLFFN